MFGKIATSQIVARDNSPLGLDATAQIDSPVALGVVAQDTAHMLSLPTAPHSTILTPTCLSFSAIGWPHGLKYVIFLLSSKCSSTSLSLLSSSVSLWYRAISRRRIASSDRLGASAYLPSRVELRFSHHLVGLLI